MDSGCLTSLALFPASLFLTQSPPSHPVTLLMLEHVQQAPIIVFLYLISSLPWVLSSDFCSNIFFLCKAILNHPMKNMTRHTSQQALLMSLAYFVLHFLLNVFTKGREFVFVLFFLGTITRDWYIVGLKNTCCINEWKKKPFAPLCKALLTCYVKQWVLRNVLSNLRFRTSGFPPYCSLLSWLWCNMS